MEAIETIIIGGGQAGLATSYYLSQHGRAHLILERAAQAGNVWRNHRWDSFTLVTPNWSFRLPGMEYQGSDPDGFMSRNEVVASFERYVQQFNLPVRYGVQVTAVHRQPDELYLVETATEMFRATNVVIATGLYQQPKKPSFSEQLSTSITQLTSDQYRNPDELPPGAVLVVGSGQTGCQIVDELCRHGRTIYLSIGGTGRAPRRYRGKDSYEWLTLAGFFDRTPDKLPSPQARFASQPHLSGFGGGRTLNLHQMSRDGVQLLGHIQGAQESQIFLAADLKESLAKCDQFEMQVTRMIDGYIAQNGLDAPAEEMPHLQDGYQTDIITELDLAAAGISTVIWAMGYSFDYSLVKLPVCAADGFPIQKRGVTSYPGLYFVGLPWLHKMKSGLLMGVGEDAAYIADQIAKMGMVAGG